MTLESQWLAEFSAQEPKNTEITARGVRLERHNGIIAFCADGYLTRRATRLSAQHIEFAERQPSRSPRSQIAASAPNKRQNRS